MQQSNIAHEWQPCELGFLSTMRDDGSRNGMTRNAAPLVLIVDDDESIREVLEDLLEMRDFRVLSACHGGEGVELCRQHSCAIGAVLLDVSMPGLSSGETLEQLRFIVPGLPVIIFSGYSEAETTVRLGERDWSGFLQKPFRIDELFTMLDRFL